MCLDIPVIIKEFSLFDIEGICTHDDTVIYTVSDVLFLDLTQTSLHWRRPRTWSTAPATPLLLWHMGRRL